MRAKGLAPLRRKIRTAHFTQKTSFLQTLPRFGLLSRRGRANMRSNAYLPIRPVQVPYQLFNEKFSYVGLYAEVLFKGLGINGYLNAIDYFVNKNKRR